MKRLSLFCLTTFFSVLSFAFEVPTIAMGPDHSPCVGKVCVQECTYKADATITYSGFEVEADVNIRTIFDNQSLGDKTALRTLISVETQMVSAKALWDETAIFDNKTFRLDKVYNFLKVSTGSGDRGLKAVEWSETAFDLPQAKVVAITAKTAAELKKNYPGFYKYLADNKFGSDWMSEFQTNKPAPQPERDMNDLPFTVLSPTFVSLFDLRFVPLGLPTFRYDLFANYSSLEDDQQFVLGKFGVDLKAKTNKENVASYEGSIAFGDFESDGPARFQVDKTTNMFKKIELSMINKAKGLKAKAWTTAISCK